MCPPCSILRWSRRFGGGWGEGEGENEVENEDEVGGWRLRVVWLFNLSLKKDTIRKTQ
jgi:hypothetical protein